MTETDLMILRRYIVGRNVESYRVDRATLAMIPDSYVKQVSYVEAVAALERLEAREGAGSS